MKQQTKSILSFFWYITSYIWYYIAIIAIVAIFTGCNVQKQSALSVNENHTDITEIKRLQSIIAERDVTIKEQAETNIELKEKIKILENAKINKTETDYDEKGNVKKKIETNIDYSKTTETEREKSLQNKINTQAKIIENLQSEKAETESRYEKKITELEQVIKSKTETKSLWWLWLVAGVILGVVGTVGVQKLLKKYKFSIFKK